jgi:hypothetical protein
VGGLLCKCNENVKKAKIKDLFCQPANKALNLLLSANIKEKLLGNFKNYLIALYQL